MYFFPRSYEAQVVVYVVAVGIIYSVLTSYQGVIPTLVAILIMLGVSVLLAIGDSRTGPENIATSLPKLSGPRSMTDLRLRPNQ